MAQGIQATQTGIFMELSNIDLIQISQFFISIMMTVVFALAWKIMMHKTYVLLWAGFYFVAAVNGVLNALNDVFPNRDLYWVVVNGLSLLTQLLAWAGFRARAGKKAVTPAIWVYFIAVELLVVLFTFVVPHMGLRMVFIPYSGALVVAMIAREIWHTGQPVRLVAKSAVVVFLLYTLVQFTSGTLALLQGAVRDPYYLNLYSQANFLFMPAFFAGLGLFTLLILVDDLVSKMRVQAVTDYLTGLLNRRGFKNEAEQLLTKAKKRQQQVAVVVADLDWFKKINDAHGHQVGDEVLQASADLLRRSLSDTDVIGRIGGEEFAMVMAGKDLPSAAAVAEQIRQGLLDLQVAGRYDFRLTASFGVAAVDDSLGAAMIRADQAMYAAKKQGRNRTEVQAKTAH